MTDAQKMIPARVPWWREPIALGIFAFVGLASLAILSEGFFVKDTGPAKQSPVPGGGTFCDPPAPVQSTAYNPSTQSSAHSGTNSGR